MEQEITLNAHNKQEFLPMHTVRFNTSIIRLFVLLLGLLALVGCASKEHAEALSDTVSMVSIDSAVEYMACAFVSNRDTNTYKESLCRLKHYVENKMDVPAQVLCDAAPRSCDEYHICYHLTEEKWFRASNGHTCSLFTMDDWLSRYAIADSNGAFEAFMLYCEFVDGYVAESAFDWLIALEEKYPERFAQSRKNRTEYWNRAFDGWKMYMAD